MQAAIDAALGAGTSVYIPRGIYRITSPLLLNLETYVIDAALRIDSGWATLQASVPGSNGGSQPLPSPVAMESVINITIASHLTINRLLIDGNNGTAQYGIKAFKVSGAQAKIEQVTVQGARSQRAAKSRTSSTSSPSPMAATACTAAAAPAPPSRT